MATTYTKSPAGSQSGSAKLSSKAKKKLQSLFKAQGIDKPDQELLTCAKRKLWSEVANKNGPKPQDNAPVKPSPTIEPPQNGATKEASLTPNKEKSKQSKFWYQLM